MLYLIHLVQDKIHQDDRATGKHRLICNNDHTRMPYIEAVSLESMRCRCLLV